jgi:hypothetical protein
MHKDASRRKFDIVMAWSVDRLGRSLQDLIGFLSELHSLAAPATFSLRLLQKFDGIGRSPLDCSAIRRQ